jgi:hypothetical protein
MKYCKKLKNPSLNSRGWGELCWMQKSCAWQVNLKMENFGGKFTLRPWSVRGKSAPISLERKKIRVQNLDNSEVG